MDNSREDLGKSKNVKWLLAAFAASGLFTGSALIRSIMSDSFMTTKGLQSLASLGNGLIYMVGAKIKRRLNDDPTPLPWS